MDLHNPARLAGESQADYRARQAKSRAAVRSMTCAGMSGGVSLRKQMRDEKRKNGTLDAGAMARALANHFTRKRVPKWAHRDEIGAYTTVGKPGRIWLAGISAQRGY